MIVTYKINITDNSGVLLDVITVGVDTANKNLGLAILHQCRDHVADCIAVEIAGDLERKGVKS